MSPTATASSPSSPFKSSSAQSDCNCTSPKQHLAYRCLRKGKTHEVLKTIVRSRKSWKTLGGSTEAVWSPDLEEALIEGLSSYEVKDSRETRMLGRFPNRNRHISAHILAVTGKYRSPKQVGSRLQQLRDTCGGKQLLKLLSPSRPIHRPASGSLHTFDRDISPPCYDTSSSTENSPSSSPISTAGRALPHHALEDFIASPTPICIDILPENVPSSSFAPYDFSAFTVGASGSSSEPASPCSSSSYTSEGSDGDILRFSSHPRYIRSIDPTITFISRFADISATSFFEVFFNNTVVHRESVPVGPVFYAQSSKALLQGQDLLLCSTSLVPQYWQTICDSPNPTNFVIRHEVHSSNPESTPIFSAVYTFQYPTRSMSLPSSYSAQSNMPNVDPSPDYCSRGAEFDMTFDHLLALDDPSCPQAASITENYFGFIPSLQVDTQQATQSEDEGFDTPRNLEHWQGFHDGNNYGNGYDNCHSAPLSPTSTGSSSGVSNYI